MSWMEIYSKDTIIKEIISELFEQYNLKSIRITPRIIDAFKSKLYRVCQQVSKAVNCGKKRMDLLKKKNETLGSIRHGSSRFIMLN